MPNYESKIVHANPKRMQEELAEYEKFGWTLQCSEEIEASSHLATYAVAVGSGLHNVKVAGYVKMTLQRDREMPNYARIAQLEQEYFSYVKPRKKNWIGFLIPAIILSVFAMPSLFVAFSTNNGVQFGNLLGSFSFPLIFWAVYIILKVTTAKRYNERNAEYISERQRILDVVAVLRRS